MRVVGLTHLGLVTGIRIIAILLELFEVFYVVVATLH